MRYLLTAILLLIAINVYAQMDTRVYTTFEYDHQNLPEYQVSEVGMIVNGVDYCQTGTATTNPAGEIEYVCADADFPPGPYEFQIFVIAANGDREESNVAMGTLPPEPDPPVVLPDMKKPIIIRGHMERDEHGTTIRYDLVI